MTTAVNTNTSAGTSTGAAAGAASLTNIAQQKDMFLKLLVAQLKNQDPSAPMDQKDMMAQMTQMSSVEQMGNMLATLQTLNFNISVSQGVSMIGRPIDYATSTDIDAAIKSSTVTGVSTINGAVKLALADGTSIEPSLVIRVTG
jgi:flagellar basal-body rod modification protein FlgD